MSAKVIGRVWDLQLPHNKLLILLALADHADHEGNNVYPSLGLVAWKTGYSEQQVRRVMKALEKDGILVPTSKTPGKVAKYRIDMNAGTLKPDRKAVKPLQNVTPDIAVSPLTSGSQGYPLHFGGGTPDIAMSPEPYKPSIEPSVKKTATASLYPQDYTKKLWPRKLVDQFEVDNGSDLKALMDAWGEMAQSLKELSWVAAMPYVEALQELRRMGCMVANFNALAVYARTHTWIKHGLTCLEMVRLYDDWRKSRTQNMSAPRPLDPAQSLMLTQAPTDEVEWQLIEDNGGGTW